MRCTAPSTTKLHSRIAFDSISSRLTHLVSVVQALNPFGGAGDIIQQRDQDEFETQVISTVKGRPSEECIISSALFHESLDFSTIF